MKAYQEGPQNGLQNASLAYSNSFNIFERVLQFQPWKIFGEASDLQTCTAGMWSLLCTPRGRIKGPWYSSSLQRKRTWSEGQKPKGWFVVWLSAAPSGCRNQINLWKAVKVFLAWVSLSKWNREIEFLWKASLSRSLCLERSVIWTLSEQPAFILNWEPLPSPFLSTVSYLCSQKHKWRPFHLHTHEFKT